jgi:hypothetical protein
MEPVSPDELAQTYSELADEELLRMHASGQLTEVAYDVLEKELTQRGISVPNRPSAEELTRRRTPIPKPPNALAKSIANEGQRVWSFSTFGDTAFRLILLCWFCSWLIIYVPIVTLTRILGIKVAAPAHAGILAELWGSLFSAGMNTIPFVIYLGIWGLWFWIIKKDKTIYVRQLCAIVYGALGVIVPTFALFSLIYWGAWESVSSQGEVPRAYWRSIGYVSDCCGAIALAVLQFTVFVQPIGLVVGSALGYGLGRVLERRGIALSNKWAIVGTLASAVLLIIGLVMLAHLTR